MKTGKIVSKQTKKGLQYLIEYDNGKSLNIDTKCLLKKINELLNQDIEFDNSGGGLKKIFTLNPSELVYEFKQQNIPPQVNRPGEIRNFPSNYQHSNIGKAHAPYNFVPINNKIAKSPFIVDDVCFNSYKSKSYNGEMFLKIKSLTPLFIRGMKSISSESPINTTEFFKGKDFCIPGSSLRGLLRTMIEIVSYSKMSSLNKDTLTKRFHYRAFADQSLTLREEYASKMLQREGRPEFFYPKVKAGVIKKEGLSYFICMGKHYKIEETLARDNKVINDLMSLLVGDKYNKNNSYKPEFKKVFFKAESETIHHHSKDLKYSKVTDISIETESSLKEGYLICSGWMVGPGRGPRSRGKHMHWIIGDYQGSKKVKIDDDVVENYINDKSRDGMNLLGKFNNETTEVPCFFITDSNNKIISFGHTGMFRLAYAKTLIEFFPDGHRLLKEPDFAEMLFGKIDLISSRVFVEDAFKSDGTFSESLRIPGIMGNPKPTTFQHYLKQDISDITPAYNRDGNISGYHGIKDYNQDTVINGNKMYWHQKMIEYPEKIVLNATVFKKYLNSKNSLNIFNGYSFQQNKIEIIISRLSTEQFNLLIDFVLTPKESQYTAIRPVLKDANFEGKIRFENLSKIELGALLFVLNFPDELCYKIGLGKALGFGSINIKSKTILSDREKRYSDLLTEWDGYDNSNRELSKKDVNEISEAFERHILSEIGSESTSLWKEQRMIELKTMLNINNSLEGEKARYMLIDKRDIDADGNFNRPNNEYKSRPILQGPSEYVKPL